MVIASAMIRSDSIRGIGRARQQNYASGLKAEVVYILWG